MPVQKTSHRLPLHIQTK